jgi:hypothetical protein
MRTKLQARVSKIKGNAKPRGAGYQPPILKEHPISRHTTQVHLRIRPSLAGVRLALPGIGAWGFLEFWGLGSGILFF